MKKLQCKNCKQLLTIAHFYKRTEIKRGYRLECKDCHRIRKAELKKKEAADLQEKMQDGDKASEE